MEITLNLPHVFHADSTPVDNAIVLKLVLDCLVGINQAYLANHSAPALYRSGVVYARTKEFEPIPAVLQRGYGDCKSLTAWRIAELRAQRIESKPVFRWHTNKYGVKDFHILVQTLQGFEDPSKTLGMGADELRWFRQ